MYTIRKTPEFDSWLKGVRDRSVRIRLLRRLEKAQWGLLGWWRHSSQAKDIEKARALAIAIKG